MESLAEYIGSKKVAVAYSGGFDSTFLLKAVADIVPSGYIGVFVDSPLISERQRAAAIGIAGHLGLRVVCVRLDWNDLPGVAANDEERCYHCKKTIYGAVLDIASEFGADMCLDGENTNDLDEHRPGRRAAREFGILSPLSDLSVGRDEIVSAVKGMNIPCMMIKDTCMATRIPTGVPFSEKDLRFVEECESLVRSISGVKQLRVRIRGNKATLLASPDEIYRLTSVEGLIIDELRKKGLEASIDPAGYK